MDCIWITAVFRILLAGFFVFKIHSHFCFYCIRLEIKRGLKGLKSIGVCVKTYHYCLRIVITR
ncbi:hypothetical protein C2R51_04485 [Helicobacter pylori]|nr:hypothetical protein C2R51_04485 [Helicobacter pylori]